MDPNTSLARYNNNIIAYFRPTNPGFAQPGIKYKWTHLGKSNAEPVYFHRGTPVARILEYFQNLDFWPHLSNITFEPVSRMGFAVTVALHNFSGRGLLQKVHIEKNNPWGGGGFGRTYQGYTIFSFFCRQRQFFCPLSSRRLE
jgi:hypothetical protein